MTPRVRSTRCSTSRLVTKRRGSATRRGRRIYGRWTARRHASCRRERKGNRNSAIRSGRVEPYAPHELPRRAPTDKDVAQNLALQRLVCHAGTALYDLGETRIGFYSRRPDEREEEPRRIRKCGELPRIRIRGCVGEACIGAGAKRLEESPIIGLHRGGRKSVARHEVGVDDEESPLP